MLTFLLSAPSGCFFWPWDLLSAFSIFKHQRVINVMLSDWDEERAQRGDGAVAQRERRRRVGTSSGDLPASSVSALQLVLQPCASRDRRRHGVQKQGERARAAHGTCAAAPGRAVDMLLDERPCSRHVGAASCSSTAVPRHCEVVWHSRTALIFRPQLALSQPGSRQVLWVCVVSCMGCAVKVRKKKLGSGKHPP